MGQIHKRFTTEQVKAILRAYFQGTLDRSSIEEILGISKTRFFALAGRYRQNPDEFSISFDRVTPSRLPASVERDIEQELLLEKGLIEDPTLPIASYNYSAIKDRLMKRGVNVALSTIIERAKDSIVTSLIRGKKCMTVR